MDKEPAEEGSLLSLHGRRPNRLHVVLCRVHEHLYLRPILKSISQFRLPGMALSSTQVTFLVDQDQVTGTANSTRMRNRTAIGTFT